MYDADLTSQHAESTPVKVAGPVNYNASSDSGVVSLGMLIYNLITTHLYQFDYDIDFAQVTNNIVQYLFWISEIWTFCS